MPRIDDVVELAAERSFARDREGRLWGTVDLRVLKAPSAFLAIKDTLEAKKTYPNQKHRCFSGRGILTTLLCSDRPLLLVSRQTPAMIGERVGVAWNGSLESARVLAATLPFLQSASSVHILTADTERTSSELTDELADYLAWHGIAGERRQVSVERRPVGAALLEEAKRHRIDLLIMGGYGHSRLQEFILGGVTRHVLGHANVSVLMTH